MNVSILYRTHPPRLLNLRPYQRDELVKIQLAMLHELCLQRRRREPNNPWIARAIEWMEAIRG